MAKLKWPSGDECDPTGLVKALQRDDKKVEMQEMPKNNNGSQRHSYNGGPAMLVLDNWRTIVKNEMMILVNCREHVTTRKDEKNEVKYDKNDKKDDEKRNRPRMFLEKRYKKQQHMWK